MSKVPTNLRIDAHLKQKAQEKGVNLSRVLTRALEDLLEPGPRLNKLDALEARVSQLEFYMDSMRKALGA